MQKFMIKKSNQFLHYVFCISNLYMIIAFSLRTLEEVIQTKDKYQCTLEKTNEALLTYVEELKKMKKFLLDTGSSSSNYNEGDIL